MKQPSSTQEMKAMIERMVSLALPRSLNQFVNNIRSATVKSVDQDARLVSVVVNGTGENISGVRYQKGATNVAPGDTCLLLAQDPRNRNQVKAIIF